MGDVIDRCQKGSCKRHNACMYAPCFSVPLFRTDLTAKPVDQFLTENNEILRAEITRLTAERDALLIALHDAIRRPMGVVPASADQFYSPAMADQAEAIRALKSPKPPIL